MFRRLGIHSDEMAVALVVWLCTLPLLGLLIVPRFGLPAAGFAALVVLIALMIVCWGMCGRELARHE